MPDQPASKTLVLRAVYFLLFLSVGVTLPFNPQYFQTLGLTSSQIGVLLAIGPLFALVAPPAWGVIADRWGRPGAVASVLFAGATLGSVLLLQARTFTAVFVAIAVSAAFSSAMTSILDSLTLQAVSVEGGTYPRIRAMGSAGFVVASLAFGALIRTVDRTVVVIALTVMATCTLFTLATTARWPRATTSTAAFSFDDVRALVKQPAVATLLVACALHWIACAPYHGSLALHLKALGLEPWVMSGAASVGVLAEFTVFTTFARWGTNLSTRTLLQLAFAGSAVRWCAVGFITNPVLLIALSVLHALTFGCFYVAAVASMERLSPPSMRATGQAMLAAATFGIGGLVGFLTSGLAYDRWGGSTLFLVAAGAELVPLALVTWVRASDTPSALSVRE